MLIHHALALLTIARREPVTYKQLEALLGLSNAAVSRTVNSLSTDVRHRKVGLGLVEISRDKHEWRRHVVELSPAGRELVAELSALMGPPA
jgi:DNA-binding MarR family transcriptional regulator